MSTTTHQLVTEANFLIASLEEAGGELTPAAEQAIAAWVAMGEDKLDRLRYVSLAASTQARMLRDESGRLLERARGVEKAEERVKLLAQELLVAHRNVTGETKLKTDRTTAWLQVSTKVVGPTDPTDWPIQYQRVKVEADRQKAKEALERGESLEAYGITIETEESLRWR
jgi:hypothetical protein